jgi:hypothetical protein
MSPARQTGSPAQPQTSLGACEPGCPDPCCQPLAARDAAWHSAARKAKRLSWLSLGYMAAEGLVAIIAAILAGSVALLGFGLDSVIEGLASVIIIWRFTGTRTLSPTAEARAQQASAWRSPH